MQKVRHLKRIKVCTRKVQLLSYPAKCFMDYLVKKGIMAGRGWAPIVEPCPLTWLSVLVATSGATPIKTLKKGIVAGHHDEALSTTSMDVVLLWGLRRNALV